MERPLKVKLHIISPVHIGCDDVYEPTGFVIDEKKRRLIEFDPMDFIKALNDTQRNDFSRLCSGNNLLDVFKFIKDNYKASIGGKEVDIASGLVGHYKDVIDKKFQINKFEIKRTAYNPHTNKTYIPGSSLKGALRTAYLTSLANEKKIKDCWNKYLQRNELESATKRYDFIGKKKVAKKLEKDLLEGDFDTDPFRMVKVSDFLPVGDVKTRIVYAVNKKKIRSDKPTKADSGPPQILEVIQHGTMFEGIINIEKPLKGSDIKTPIVTKKLLASINNFYTTLNKEENKVSAEIKAASIVLNEGFKDRLGETAFLVRIGRHSGAEAVTIEGNRYIKIMQGKGQQHKYLDHATTIWLASEVSKPNTSNGLIPFGWAVMEVVE